MSPKIPPYRQGGLDKLCGVYALINASRLADPTLKQKACEEVYLEAVCWLQGNGSHRVQLDGLTFNTLLSLHSRVFQEQWPQIRLRRPFMYKRDVPSSAEDFWLWMKNAASQRGQGVFIGIESNKGHWSAVREINSTHIYLFDSDKWPNLQRSECGCFPEERKKYLIEPKYVLLLVRN